MEKWEGKVALVTGASAGMGAAIARALVEKGLIVIGMARRIERIEEQSKKITGTGKLLPLRCDISREEDILKAFKWIKENLGSIHILINNAGLTRTTNLTDGATEEWRKVFDVNVLGLCICTREAIRIMRENKISGHIINMNSVAGHYVTPMPEPVLNVYPASKFAVTAITETLRQELRHFKSKIKVTSISPGVVKTDFSDGFTDDRVKSAVTNMPFLKSEDIAEAVIYVLSTAPHVQVQELIIRPLGEPF